MRRAGVVTRTVAALLVAGAILALASGSTRRWSTTYHPGISPRPAREDVSGTPASNALLVLAHRGGIENARENTMGSFNDAIAIGADYIETDVRHSADGVAFLIHDPTLTRVCTPYTGRAVRSLTSSQLAQVRCGGQPIPRLTDLVTRLQRPDAARISVFPEIKDVDPLGVRDALAPLGWSRVTVQSSNYDALRQIKQASPQVRTCPLIWSADGLNPALAVTHDCVAPDFHLVDATFVAKAHAAGAVVFPFTVDDPAAMRSVAALGVDGVITNRPRLARATLGR
jgi:glycerophosphoryl diester phosphodiesterase